jgi:nucleotide-binding universal stress UspA family protein
LSKEAEMSAIKKILVPMDFSDASRQSLRYACTLADALDASLHIIHVSHDPYVPGGFLEVYVPPPDFAEQVNRETARELEALLTAEERNRYRAVLVHRIGPAAYEILDYLREQGDVDLVVMATHGRGGVARLMMGSVTDKIVRAAPCPVLTLRAAGQPDEHAGGHPGARRTRGEAPGEAA